MNKAHRNQKNDNRICKGFFNDAEAQKFADQLCFSLPKGIMYRWFWLGFQAMEKAGLTYYETDHEELQVRLRINLMVLIFYEYCHRIHTAYNGQFQSWGEEFLMELLKDLYELDMSSMHSTLINYFDGAYNLESEMWLLCQEGEHDCLIPRYKTNEKMDHDEEIRQKAFEWIDDGFSHISNFECMQSFDQDRVLNKK